MNRKKLIPLVSLVLFAALPGCTEPQQETPEEQDSLQFDLSIKNGGREQQAFDETDSDTWERTAFLDGDEVKVFSQDRKEELAVLHYESAEKAWKTEQAIDPSAAPFVLSFVGNAYDELEGEAKVLGQLFIAKMTHRHALVEVKVPEGTGKVVLLMNGGKEQVLVAGKSSGYYRTILPAGTVCDGLEFSTPEGEQIHSFEKGVSCLKNHQYRYVFLLADGQLSCAQEHGEWGTVRNEPVPQKPGKLVSVSRGTSVQIGDCLSFLTQQTNFGKLTKIGTVADGKYIYISWWKGGLANRNMMLARYNTETSKVAVIEFPDKHIGFHGEYLKAEQKDPAADLRQMHGDPHNNIAIGICKADGTIHLLYDMHAYTAQELPEHFFNYRVSRLHAADVPDEEFTLELFQAKTNKLNSSTPKSEYERVTYPTFLDLKNGDLCVNWRKGGSGSGKDYLTLYDGQKHEWAPKAILISDGLQGGKDTYSIYGSPKSLDGKICYGFHVRYAQRDESKVRYNQGLHYCECENPFQSNVWTDAFGKPHNFPLQKASEVEFGPDPVTLGYSNSISDNPSWLKTPDGAFHFISNPGGITNGKFVHHYKAKGADKFSYGLAPAKGVMRASNGYIVMSGVDKGKHPFFATCPEGTNDWEEVASFPDQVDRFGGPVVGNVLYSLEFKAAVRNSLPLYLVQYQLNYR